MAVVLPPPRREHWVSKVDKKLSMIPIIGTATNLTKLFAKLFFKALEYLLPPVYRPIKSQRIVRAITNKKIDTYLSQAIPFWFVFTLKGRCMFEQPQVGPSLQSSHTVKQNWDLFEKLTYEFNFFTTEFRFKTEEFHQLKWSDPQKFEIESQTVKEVIETSLQNAKVILNDLTPLSISINSQYNCLCFQDSLVHSFGERIALYYPDISSPPLYLEQSDPLDCKIIEAWKQNLPRMSEKPPSLQDAELRV